MTTASRIGQEIAYRRNARKAPRKESHQAAHDRVDQQIADFLAAGGCICEVPPGASGQKIFKTAAECKYNLRERDYERLKQKREGM